MNTEQQAISDTARFLREARRLLAQADTAIHNAIVASPQTLGERYADVQLAELRLSIVRSGNQLANAIHAVHTTVGRADDRADTIAD